MAEVDYTKFKNTADVFRYELKESLKDNLFPPGGPMSGKGLLTAIDTSFNEFNKQELRFFDQAFGSKHNKNLDINAIKSYINDVTSYFKDNQIKLSNEMSFDYDSTKGLTWMMGEFEGGLFDNVPQVDEYGSHAIRTGISKKYDPLGNQNKYAAAAKEYEESGREYLDRLNYLVTQEQYKNPNLYADVYDSQGNPITTINNVEYARLTNEERAIVDQKFGNDATRKIDKAVAEGNQLYYEPLKGEGNKLRNWETQELWADERAREAAAAEAAEQQAAGTASGSGSNMGQSVSEGQTAATVQLGPEPEPTAQGTAGTAKNATQAAEGSTPPPGMGQTIVDGKTVNISQTPEGKRAIKLENLKKGSRNQAIYSGLGISGNPDAQKVIKPEIEKLVAQNSGLTTDEMVEILKKRQDLLADFVEGGAASETAEQAAKATAETAEKAAKAAVGKVDDVAEGVVKNANINFAKWGKIGLGVAVGGGLLFSALSSNRGQQNNAQLYGQQPLY